MDSVDIGRIEPRGVVNAPVIAGEFPSAPLDGQRVDRADEPMDSINQAAKEVQDHRAKSHREQKDARADLVQPEIQQPNDQEPNDNRSEHLSEDAVEA